jgi:hypothetical protein
MVVFFEEIDEGGREKKAAAFVQDPSGEKKKVVKSRGDALEMLVLAIAQLSR